MASKGICVGVDLGGTKILAGVVNRSGKVLSRAKKRTRPNEGVKAVVERICAAVEESLAAAKETLAHVTALGVGAAGPVDVERGVVLTAGNMPWSNVPLAEMLRKRLGVRQVVVDNDANAGTYGEWKAGAGEGCPSLLGVFIGTGIGGGLVLDGKLYHGHGFTAGEIGHTIINTGGGVTGRNLEDLASRGALGVILARRIATNHPSSLTKSMELESMFTSLRSGALAEAYVAGDPVTVQCVEEAARYNGTAIASAVTLLSLQRVVVGGGLVEALGKPFVKLIAEQMRADVWPESLKTEVVEAKLGDDAILVGSALLARDATKKP